MFFNPVKYVFNSILSWVVLLIVGLGGYLGYVTVRAQAYTPTGISTIFSELVRNPTPVISTEEENRIEAILDTGVLSQRRFQELVLLLRRLDQTYPLRFERIVPQSSFATVEYALANTPNQSGVKLFLQETGTWYTGIRHRIFHVELSGLAALEETNLERGLSDTLEQAREVVEENFNRLQESYGQEVLDFIRTRSEE